MTSKWSLQFISLFFFFYSSSTRLYFRGLSENGNDDDVERPKTKVTIVENLTGDDARSISNVTSNVASRVGSMFEKGIGGLSTKLGGFF